VNVKERQEHSYSQQNAHQNKIAELLFVAQFRRRNLDYTRIAWAILQL
jgi:hypothetical protein